MSKLSAIIIVLVSFASIPAVAADSGLKDPSSAPLNTIDTIVGGSEQRACTCSDHPKPGYDCNSCDIVDGQCRCIYGLKSAN